MAVSCNPDAAVCLSDLTINIWQTSDGSEVSGVGDLTTPGGIITAAWPYAFAIGGLILFAMLVWGALEIQFGAATPKSAESGKQRITNAVIGFVLLFSVFWMGQLIQQIFGLNFAVGQEVSIPGDGGGSGGGGTNPPPVPDTPIAVSYQTRVDAAGSIQICTSSSNTQFRDISASSESVLYRNGAEVSRRTATFPTTTYSGGSSFTRCATVGTQNSAIQTIKNDLLQRFPASAVNQMQWQFRYSDGGTAGNVIITPNTSNVEGPVAGEIAQYILTEFPDYELWNTVTIGNSSTNVIIAFTIPQG